ncbi:hypothetical protein KEM54_003175, partial [Ascosphaera aggregata]
MDTWEQKTSHLSRKARSLLRNLIKKPNPKEEPLVLRSLDFIPNEFREQARQYLDSQIKNPDLTSSNLLTELGPVLFKHLYIRSDADASGTAVIEQIVERFFGDVQSLRIHLIRPHIDYNLDDISKFWAGTDMQFQRTVPPAIRALLGEGDSRIGNVSSLAIHLDPPILDQGERQENPMRQIGIYPVKLFQMNTVKFILTLISEKKCIKRLTLQGIDITAFSPTPACTALEPGWLEQLKVLHITFASEGIARRRGKETVFSEAFRAFGAYLQHAQCLQSLVIQYPYECLPATVGAPGLRPAHLSSHFSSRTALHNLTHLELIQCCMSKGFNDFIRRRARSLQAIVLRDCFSTGPPWTESTDWTDLFSSLIAGACSSTLRDVTIDFSKHFLPFGNDSCFGDKELWQWGKPEHDPNLKQLWENRASQGDRKKFLYA